MTTDYTKKVKNSIIKIAKKCKRIREIETEDKLWLGTAKGTDRSSTYFVSDVTLQLVNSKVLIIQLCDSQSQDQKKIYGDFFTALISREVSKVFFIVPPKKEEDISKICRVSVSNLKHKLKVEEDRIVAWRVFPVPKTTEENIEERIKTLAYEEKWGYEE